MSLEQQVAELVTSTNALTTSVVAKMGQIDATVAQATDRLDAQLASRSFTLRNRVINGDMRTDQRNAGAALAGLTNSTRAFAVDRFRTNGTTLPVGRFSMQRVSDAPDGFTASLKVTITTAEPAAAAQVLVLEHALETQNISDFSWGSEAAQPAVLSFWAKSSIAGAYTVAVRSASAPDTSYLGGYVIQKPNTWEHKTIAVPGPKGGTWNKTSNGLGAMLSWNLGCGANFVTAGGAWTNGSQFRTAGDVNLVETLGSTLQITGVQLEKGDVATPFEFRPIALELQLCQRYYFQSATFLDPAPRTGDVFAIGVAVNTNWLYTMTPVPPVPMRAGPTVLVKSVDASRTVGAVTDWLTNGPVTIGSVDAGLLAGPKMQMSGTLTSSRAYAFDYSLSAEL